MNDNEGDGADFRGQNRSNETPASTTDPESRLSRKAAGREARLCSMGHVTMENHHGEPPWRTTMENHHGESPWRITIENRHGLAVQGSSQRPMARRNGALRKPC